MPYSSTWVSKTKTHCSSSLEARTKRLTSPGTLKKPTSRLIRFNQSNMTVRELGLGDPRKNKMRAEQTPYSLEYSLVSAKTGGDHKGTLFVSEASEKFFCRTNLSGSENPVWLARSRESKYSLGQPHSGGSRKPLW